MRRFRWFLCWIVLGAAPLVLSGCRYLPPYDHYQRGMKYFNQKDYVRARIELAKSFKDHPTPDAHYYFGVASEELKDYESAGRAFLIAENTEGKKEGPHSLDLRLRLARLLFMVHDNEGAIRRCNWVLKHDPANPRAKELQAFALAALSQSAKSTDLLEDLLTGDPANLDARVLLASIKLQAQDRDEAEHQLLEGAQRANNSPASLVPLANFYLITDQTEKAEPLLVDAIRKNPQELELRLILGWLYAQSKQFDKAEAIFREVVNLHPKNADQRGILVTYYFARGEFPKAIQELESMVRADPSDTGSKVRLAGAYFLSGRYADSRKLTDELLKQDPQNLRARLISALLLEEEDKNTEALTEFTNLLHSMGDSAHLHYLIGLAYEKDRNMELAQQSMERALKLDKSFLPSRLWMADHLTRAGSLKPAFGMLREAPETQVNSPQLRLRMALVEQGLHDVAASCDDVHVVAAENGPALPQFYNSGFGKVLDQCPKIIRPALEKELEAQPASIGLLTELAHIVAVSESRRAALARVEKQIHSVKELEHSAPHWLLDANVAEGLNDPEGARRMIQRAIQSAPNSPDPALAMVQLEISLHNWDAAQRDGQELVKRWPDSSDGWMWLGSIDESRGNLAEATRAYDKALAVNPRNAVAANNLAWRLAFDNGDATRAVALAKRAANLQPGNPGFADTLGFALYKAKQLKPAQAMLQDAIRRDPKNPSFVYHMALVEKEAGDPAAALEDLKKALGINPKFAEAKEAQAAIGEIQRKFAESR